MKGGSSFVMDTLQIGEGGWRAIRIERDTQNFSNVFYNITVAIRAFWIDLRRSKLAFVPSHTRTSQELEMRLGEDKFTHILSSP